MLCQNRLAYYYNKKANSYGLFSCNYFEQNNHQSEPKILIEGGRFTADKEHGIVRANFHRAPDRTLTSAVWFVRKDTSSTPEKSHLEPISSETDSRKIETFYQMAIEASTSFGQGIDSVLKEEVVFEDGSKVFLSLTVRGSFSVFTCLFIFLISTDTKCPTIVIVEEWRDSTEHEKETTWLAFQ